MVQKDRVYIEYEYGTAIHSAYSREEYRSILETMLCRLESRYKVSLYLLSDACMVSSVQRYMYCNSPTNILSFEPTVEAPDEIVLLLSLQTMRRECLLYAQSPESYTISLLAHGLVHGHGYEHGSSMDLLCEQCCSCVLGLFS